jgi:hypothetical protein
MDKFIKWIFWLIVPTLVALYLMWQIAVGLNVSVAAVFFTVLGIIVIPAWIYIAYKKSSDETY